MKIRARLVLAVCLMWPASGYAKENVVAVLSSELQPYQDALQGFQQSYGGPVDTVHLATQPPGVRGQPQVIVAIGGKAALQRYPETSIVIYCMAPGAYLAPADFRNTIIQVSMMPKPERLLQSIQEIQPKIERLAVLWNSLAYGGYIDDLRKAGHDHGVEILADRLEKPGVLPDRLRGWQGRADAILMTADPILINNENLVLITQYSWSNHMPFYAAAGGLTEKGAAAAFSVEYTDIGRAAGAAAQKAMSGAARPTVVYGEPLRMEINVGAARKAGLSLAPAVLQQAKKVIP